MNDSIAFTNWVGENHYVLYDVNNGVYIWHNEENKVTTEQLYEKYKSEKLNYEN